jgi:hypothetical protein
MYCIGLQNFPNTSLTFCWIILVLQYTAMLRNTIFVLSWEHVEQWSPIIQRGCVDPFISRRFICMMSEYLHGVGIQLSPARISIFNVAS